MNIKLLFIGIITTLCLVGCPGDPTPVNANTTYTKLEFPVTYIPQSEYSYTRIQKIQYENKTFFVFNNTNGGIFVIEDKGTVE